MEAMFGKMMEGCMKGMSEEDKKKMMAFGEKMAAMFSSTGMKDMTEDGKKAMREKIDGVLREQDGAMSACFKSNSKSDQTCCAEKV